MLGVIGNTAIHLREREDEKAPKVHELYVDLGASNPKEVDKAGNSSGTSPGLPRHRRRIRPQPIVGRALDNRIGGFIIAEVTRRLAAEASRPEATLVAANCIHEEIGGMGSMMVAHRLRPDVCVVLDVTHATDSPGIGEDKHGKVTLGGGPSITHGAANHPLVISRIMDTAKKEKSPCNTKPLPASPARMPTASIRSGKAFPPGSYRSPCATCIPSWKWPISGTWNRSSNCSPPSSAPSRKPTPSRWKSKRASLMTTRFAIPVFLCLAAVPAAMGDSASEAATATVLESLGAKVTRTNGSVTEVYLTDCTKIGEPELRAIGALANLKSLTLFGKLAGLTDQTVDSLLGLSQLQSLSTEGAQLGDEGLAKLAALKSLRSVAFFHLSFRKEGFTGQGFAAWKALPNLQRLTVAGMSMGDDGFAAIAQIKSLTELSTWHTWQTEAGNAEIAKLPNLTTFKAGQRLPRTGITAPS